MVGLINNCIEAAHLQNSANNEPSWISAVRLAALEQLKTLQDPNRKNELWRYADANRLHASLENPSIDKQLDVAGTDQDEVVVIISETGAEVSGACPDWLTVSSIDSMQAPEWHDLAFDQETAINLVNTLLFKAGAFIQIKAAKEPVKIKLVYEFGVSSDWRYVRNHIELGEHVKATVTEQHVSGHINVVNLYAVAEAGQLLRKQNISLQKTDKFISYNQFEVLANAEVTNMNHHIGGLLQHHQHVVNFNSNHSKFISGSINKSFDNNNITDIVKVNHNKMNNRSDVTHRSIATDQSQIFNNAKALVAVGADQSEIEQDLKNILLSPDAKIFSKPELEVYADEVIAAHGSTIGALDEQSLFYLQSRGIDLAQCRDIMIESFEKEALVC